MSYISERTLRSHGMDWELKRQADRYLAKSRQSARITAFLSHSHKDRVLAEGLSRLLASRGVSLYIDWRDEKMPSFPDRNTARLLKEQIRRNTLFIILATKNATWESMWVPWEIGVADQSKLLKSILLVPVGRPARQLPWQRVSSALPTIGLCQYLR